jgi:hypothetical protein
MIFPAIFNFGARLGDTPKLKRRSSFQFLSWALRWVAHTGSAGCCEPRQVRLQSAPHSFRSAAQGFILSPCAVDFSTRRAERGNNRRTHSITRVQIGSVARGRAVVPSPLHAQRPVEAKPSPAIFSRELAALAAHLRATDPEFHAEEINRLTGGE